jgi:hypothetical protein
MSFEFDSPKGERLGISHADEPKFSGPGETVEWVINPTTGKIVTKNEGDHSLVLAEFRFTLPNGEIRLWGEGEDKKPYGVPCRQYRWTDSKSNRSYDVFHIDL